MSNQIWTVTPDTAVSSAARLCNEDGLRHLLVLEDGNLSGIVSARRLRAGRPLQVIKDVMSSPVLCVSPDQNVGECLQIMAEKDVGCLPVVGGNFLLGIVTDRHLLGDFSKPAPPVEGYERRPEA